MQSFSGLDAYVISQLKFCIHMAFQNVQKNYEIFYSYFGFFEIGLGSYVFNINQKYLSKHFIYVLYADSNSLLCFLFPHVFYRLPGIIG